MLYCALLGMIILLLFRSIYKFLFGAPSLKEYHYPHSEPGLLYGVSYAIYRIYLAILYRRRKRLDDSDYFAKNAKECGFLPTEKITKMELPQKLSPKMMDELRLCGVDVESGTLLDISIARQPNGSARVWLNLILKNGENEPKHYESSVKYVRNVNGSTGDVWVCKDLKIWCLNPLKKWRVTFCGFLRDKTSGDIDEVQFKFIWSPFSAGLDHLNCATNKILAHALAKSKEVLPLDEIKSVLNQYDYWGVFYGQISVNQCAYQDLILRGSKSRHIGDFSWDNVHTYVNIKLFFKNATAISVNSISIMSGSIPEMTWGYVELPASITNRITDTDLSLPMFHGKEFPDLFSIRLETDDEKFIINIKMDKIKFENEWGSMKWPNMDIEVRRVKAQMINLTHNITSEGFGSFHYGRGRDYVSPKVLDSEEINFIQVVEVTDTKVKDKSILLFDDLACSDSSLTGGKGSSLAMLTSVSKNKFKVPMGFCMTIAAHKAHLAKNPNIQDSINALVRICRNGNANQIMEASKKIEDEIRKSELSKDLKEEVSRTLLNSFGDKYESNKFAVRSSAAGEDGEEISGAGQMETFLGCKGLDEIVKSVVKCWASLYGYKAVEYRRINGQIIDVGMAVVIQEMVAAEAAGVMFTRHPMSGSPSLITISANSGLGESVVSATCDPDSIEIQRSFDDNVSLGKISIGKKESKIVMNEDGGSESVNIDKEEAAKCCLTEDQCLELATIGVYVEKCYGNPRDIEWALYDQKIYLLQSRPITSFDQMNEFELINEVNTPLKTNSEQLSTGNVKEVMPGAMSTLWNSYGEFIFVTALSRLAAIPSRRPKFSPIINNGSVIHKWHRFFNRIEMTYHSKKKFNNADDKIAQNGIDVALNGRVMEDSEDIKKIGTERFRFMTKMEQILITLSVIRTIFSTKKYMNAMKCKFSNLNLRHDECKTAEKLANTLFMESEPLIKAMELHVSITLSSAFVNGMLLKDLILGNGGELTKDQYSDFSILLSVDVNSNEVESADVPSALKNLAEEIKKNISDDEFLKMSKQEAVEWLNTKNNPVYGVFQNFLDKHGHRTIKEFDFISKTWSMENAQLIDPLKAIVSNKNPNTIAKLSVDEALKTLKTKLSPKSLKSLRGNVIKARDFVACREKAKSLLIRTVHEYRKEIIRLGEMMVSEGRLPNQNLIMHMTPYETLSLIKTRSPVFIQRAIRRQKLQPKINKMIFDEISFGYPSPIKASSVLYSEGCVSMNGTPVSHGIVEATARVVMTIEEADKIQPGDILITHSTDIAWSPYFPSLGGVVTELGGLISHGAVVAREYGIPCVVSATGATSAFKSGELIRLDGSTGKIERLEKME